MADAVETAKATAAARTSKSTTRITVACKMPHGLRLRLHDFMTVSRPVLGGGVRDEKEARVRGDAGDVRIFGTAVIQGDSLPHEVVGGYALTPNVDAEFFLEWLKQNKDHDAVRNNLIFACDSSEDARAQAKEQSAVRSGLERLDPRVITNKDGEKVHVDPRIPRRLMTDDKPSAS